jgi:translation initiation factor 4E
MNSNKNSKSENSNELNHPLFTNFTFWFRINETSTLNPYKNSINFIDYENQVKKLSTFSTIEDFWKIFQHLKKPEELNIGIEIDLFKNEIKPVWEEEVNKNGGKIALKLNKNFTSIIWEELIFAFIGGNFPDNIKNEINGILISSKKEFNVLQIWFRDYNFKIIKEIQYFIKNLLQIPKEIKLNAVKFFKSNNYNNNYNVNNKNYLNKHY